eukprot:Gb_37520 [translate_table: standard]
MPSISSILWGFFIFKAYLTNFFNFYLFLASPLCFQEFDWEAAVAEIDDACKRVASATTLHGDAFPTLANNEKIIDRLSKPNIECHVSKLPQKTNKAVRQSTLDKFVGITEKCPEDHLSHYQNWTTNCENGARLYTTEGVKSDIDPVAAKTWTYPACGIKYVVLAAYDSMYFILAVNVPLRDYQFAIVKTALFSNTLVSLPTGLGKTLIAAVVMYNYFRWFPAAKHYNQKQGIIRGKDVSWKWEGGCHIGNEGCVFNHVYWLRYDNKEDIYGNENSLWKRDDGAAGLTNKYIPGFGTSSTDAFPLLFFFSSFNMPCKIGSWSMTSSPV